MKVLKDRNKLKHDDTVIKVDGQVNDENETNSRLQWSQLTVTICIPIVIAIYTIIQDRQDLNKANMARASEFQIAQENRLNELLIAEDNRQKDRDLALDQQLENILVEYHRFLSGLLNQRGVSSLREHDKTALLLMSHSALNQLNTKRKRYVIRSLYEAKLITLNRDSRLNDVSVLGLGRIDLSNVVLGSVHDSQSWQAQTYLIDWHYLHLPRVNFRNASFRHAMLRCSTFSNTNFDFADLSFTVIKILPCFTKKIDILGNFNESSFVNATFYRADYYGVLFIRSNFTLANMTGFQCYDCDFHNSVLVQADFTGCLIVRLQYHKVPDDFYLTDLSHAIAHRARFTSINFNSSDWSHVQGTGISLRNCTFANAKIINASFVKGTIRHSLFEQTNLSYVDLSYAALENVSFVHATMDYANLSYIKCEYCSFTNIDLRNSLLRNASLHHSSFLNSYINENQLEEGLDLSGSELPNGTIVRDND